MLHWTFRDFCSLAYIFFLILFIYVKKISVGFTNLATTLVLIYIFFHWKYSSFLLICYNLAQNLSFSHSRTPEFGSLSNSHPWEAAINKPYDKMSVPRASLQQINFTRRITISHPNPQFNSKIIKKPTDWEIAERWS